VDFFTGAPLAQNGLRHWNATLRVGHWRKSAPLAFPHWRALALVRGQHVPYPVERVAPRPTPMPLYA
jgi:hypothetical protein